MRPARLLAGGLAVLATAIAAALAPLWTYALSLALFGLPHVLTELRYVDERFTQRLPRRTIRWLGAGLLAIVGLRLCALGEVGTGTGRALLELLFGAGLVAAAVPLLLPRGRSAVAVSLGTALLAGALFAPVATLVGLALLHNLTPVGLLAERLRGAERRAALVACGIAFGVVPGLLLAFAGPGAVLDGPFDTAHLDAHLPAFVPAPWLGTAFADRLFAAAAYLQCLHYAVVLHVLPRLSGGVETGGALVRWPRRGRFLAAVAGLGGVFALGFAADFGGTRSVYALFAAVHAWLEIPVLALACGVLPATAPQWRAAA